jgi:hypothetical protein
MTGPEDGIVLLLDADDSLGCTLGPELLAHMRRARPDRRCSVVVAVREFEGWFLWAAESLRGQRGLAPDLRPPDNPEGIRDAKGWLSRHRIDNRSYQETIDQAALTALFDIDVARQSPSFDKLCREMMTLFGVDAP